METYRNELNLLLPVGFRLPKDVEKKDWAGSGKFGTLVVPDYICGVSIKKSACIHDRMYEIGKTKRDKKQADNIFYKNMMNQIKECDLALKPTAKSTVWIYYKAVVWFGDNAFWSGKQKQKKQWWNFFW